MEYNDTNQRKKEEEEQKDFKDLKVVYNFQANPSDLYDCLLNPQRIPYYTRSPAQIEPKEGGTFNFYNGAILGEITKLEKDTKIVMKWKLKDWKDFSIVTISFKKENGTLLSLNQSNIPSSEFERTQAGWKNYFWEPIRVVFGFTYTQK